MMPSEHGRMEPLSSSFTIRHVEARTSGKRSGTSKSFLLANILMILMLVARALQTTVIPDLRRIDVRGRALAFGTRESMQAVGLRLGTALRTDLVPRHMHHHPLYVRDAPELQDVEEAFEDPEKTVKEVASKLTNWTDGHPLDWTSDWDREQSIFNLTDRIAPGAVMELDCIDCYYDTHMEYEYYSKYRTQVFDGRRAVL